MGKNQQLNQLGDCVTRWTKSAPMIVITEGHARVSIIVQVCCLNGVSSGCLSTRKGSSIKSSYDGGLMRVEGAVLRGSP